MDASVHTDEADGMPRIALTLSESGAARMEALTRDQLGQRLAIVRDGAVMAAPIIQSPIRADVEITLGHAGSFEEAHRDAEDLAVVLRSGTLPAPLVAESEQLIGPAFGATERIATFLVGPVVLLLLSIALTIRYWRQLPVSLVSLFALAGAAFTASLLEATVTAWFLYAMYVACAIMGLLGAGSAELARRDRAGASLALMIGGPLAMLIVFAVGAVVAVSRTRGAMYGAAMGTAGALPFMVLTGLSLVLVARGARKTAQASKGDREGG